MKVKAVCLLLIVCLLSIIPGCWDIKDVNNTAFAITIGIDKPDNPKKGKYLVTLEFAKPAQGRPNSGSESLVKSVEADSILKAIQRIQTDLSRNISLSHLRVVVIGEEIAKTKDFKDLTNYLMREPRVALRMRLVFVQGGKAHDIFYTKHSFERLLGSEIVDFGQAQDQLSLVRTNNFLDFISELKSTKGVALGSRVSIQGQKKDIIRDGAVVYKNWKLAAWLNEDEAQNANWIIKKTLPIVIVEEGNKAYTYQVSKWSRKIIPVVTNGETAFVVKINTEGMVMEEEGTDLDFSKPSNLKKMESIFSDSIKQQASSAIDKSQNEVEADYLGFGKAFKQHHPEAFKALNWGDIYPTIPIEVQVSCKVKGYGLRS